MQTVHPSQFLSANCPILDVRSPGEFAHGHIPGAVSFPLFSDAERAEVGTTYKQIGKNEALLLGLEHVGPKMADFVREAERLAPDRQVAVHCWRGGQRSRSMAWLLESAGFKVALLDGGYKNYRQHVLETFENWAGKLVVLGGRTGTGKTKILHELKNLGEQVLDLEALAHHKGSAFGWINEEEQPSVEQFENTLHAALLGFDLARRVWVENESRSIGRVFIPNAFWEKMRVAPLVNVEIPHAARLENLLEDYADCPVADLELSFQKIAKKLGGQHLKAALDLLAAGDFRAAAEIALHYYDKTYQFGLENTPAQQVLQMKFDFGAPSRIAEQLTFVKNL